MKLNAHNNPPVNNGSRKGKQKQKQQQAAPKRRHDPAITARNKAKRIEKHKQQVIDSGNKVLTVKHGTARKQRRAQKQDTYQHVHDPLRLVHLDIRAQLIACGVVKPKQESEQ